MTTSIRVGNARLLKLADQLDKVKRSQFDFTDFVGCPVDGKSPKEDLSCGTSACALGWAGSMPLFRRLGLKLEVERYVDAFYGPRMSIELQYKGDEHSVFEGASEIFAIDEDQAMSLFDPYNNAVLKRDATAKQVAKAIRKLVASRSGRKPTGRK